MIEVEALGTSVEHTAIKAMHPSSTAVDLLLAAPELYDAIDVHGHVSICVGASNSEAPTI